MTLADINDLDLQQFENESIANPATAENIAAVLNRFYK